MSKKNTNRTKNKGERLAAPQNAEVFPKKRKLSRSWNFIPSLKVCYSLEFLFFFFLWWLFSFRYDNLLYVVWHHEGFYLEWETISEAFTYISEPLTRFSSLIIQLFAFPFWGGLLMSILGVVIVHCLARRIFRNGFGLIYAVLLSLYLIVVLTRQGYYIFGFRSFAFFFQLFIGLVISSLLINCYYRLRTTQNRILFALLAIGFGYPFVGSIILCYGLYFIKVEMDEFRFSHEKKPNHQIGQINRSVPWKRLLFLTVLTWGTPFVWYPFYSARIPLCMLYANNFYYREITLVDLATVAINHIYGLVFVGLLIIPVLISLFLFLLKLNPAWRGNHFKQNRQNVTMEGITEDNVLGEGTPLKPLPLGTPLILVVIPFLLLTTVLLARHDAPFMTALAMMRPFEEKNWEKIIELEGKLKTSLLPLIELRKQAQLETNTLTEHCFDRVYDYQISQDLVSVSSFRIYGLELMMLNGNINHSYRHTMNDFQFRRNESPHQLKILFWGALFNEEYILAERYLLRLERTPFRQRWCRELRTIWETCQNNSNTDNIPEDIKEKIKYVELIRSLRPVQDYLGGDDLHYLPCVTYASRFRETAALPVKYRELQLLHLLMLRDYSRFRNLLKDYYTSQKQQGIMELPLVFQQSLLYIHFVETKRCELPTDFPCSGEVLRLFKDYVSLMIRYSHNKDPNVQLELFEKYRDTCWFYFDFSSQFMFY